MRINFIPMVLMLLLIAGCATVEHRVASAKDPFAMPIDEFLEEVDKLRVSMAQGEPREFEPQEIERFDQMTEQIKDLIGDATELEQITMYYRTRLYELRTQMVKMMVGDADPTMICFKQHTTGTRLRGNTRCYTLQEVQENKFEAERLTRYIQDLPQGRHPDS